MFSAAPAAIDALVTGFTTITGLVVFDGPPVGADAAKDHLAVGYGAYDDVNAVDSSQEWAALRAGDPPREETLDITCLLVCPTGNTAMSEVRARADGYLTAASAVIAADRTLGGAVRVARVSTFRLMNEQTKNGAVLGVEFRVTCQQRIT